MAVINFYFAGEDILFRLIGQQVLAGLKNLWMHLNKVLAAFAEIFFSTVSANKKIPASIPGFNFVVVVFYTLNWVCCNKDINIGRRQRSHDAKRKGSKC